jgi:hypothetical protein
MHHIISIPLLAIVIAVYLAMAPGGGMFLDGDAYSMVLPSGVEMTLRGSDFFLIAGIIALFLDMLKARRAGSAGRALLALTFLAALGCFLLFAPAATPAFLLLTVMAAAGALAGFARRV